MRPKKQVKRAAGVSRARMYFRRDHRFPGAHPSIAALEWYGWTDVKAAASSLKWLVNSAPSLEPPPSRGGKDLPALVVRRWQLTQSCSPKRMSHIVGLVGNEKLGAWPLECKAQYIHEAAATNSKEP